jgi:hypothetical protein
LECRSRQREGPFIARERFELLDTVSNHGYGFQYSDGTLQTLWRPLVSSSPASGLSPMMRSEAHFSHPFIVTASANPFLLYVADLLSGIRCYNFHPDAIRRLQTPSPGSMLETDGRNLASVIEGLKEIDDDSVQRVREYLSVMAPEVRHFDVVRYGEYETVRFRLRSGADGSPLEFDAASISDGTLRALAAMMAAFQIHLPAGPTVIGIEEPETSLHPAATRALVDALREATQRTQVLLTTHSGDLLADRDIDASQVLVVRNRGGQTQIAPVDPASREIVRKELYTLADLQRMDQLDLDEADLERQARAQRQDGEA